MIGRQVQDSWLFVGLFAGNHKQKRCQEKQKASELFR
jgi:hypothetical protein